MNKTAYSIKSHFKCLKLEVLSDFTFESKHIHVNKFYWVDNQSQRFWDMCNWVLNLLLSGGCFGFADTLCDIIIGENHEVDSSILTESFQIL
jgi:hypothetical protein